VVQHRNNFAFTFNYRYISLAHLPIYLVQVLDALLEAQFAVFSHFPVKRSQSRVRELLEEGLQY
jgi:hypothetical protein